MFQINLMLNTRHIHSVVMLLLVYITAWVILQVIHAFDAQAEGELSLTVDDYVVLRQVLLLHNFKE